MLLPDDAHFALAFDRRLDHERIEAQFAQCRRRFFHFGRSALTMACHPFQVVVGDRAPIERWIVVFERRRYFLQYAGAGGCQEAFERQGFDAFDHHAADHFDGRGGSGFGVDDGELHFQFTQQGRYLLCVRAGDQ